ncbi:hypothetical protein PR048_003621 [Dryococelus australis]|uniref:Retrotransposon gag domain-containing protein n=1 Tax=Dryococelus australis TaxID=614101 RepID=A0ABQ9INK4_9NEOP|nr:hypothetical protein PR048_003621 [Dryococelus australis]
MKMTTLKLPKCLVFSGNIAENFKRFKQSFDLYMMASGGNTQTSEVNSTILFHVIGEEALDIYKTFGLTEEDRKDYTKIMDALRSIAYQNRMSQWRGTRNQLQNETIDQYTTELTSLSRDCEFGEIRDSLIRDK